MKIYTINRDSTVSEGATVENYMLADEKTQVPAIVIGEQGRGRKTGILPVKGIKLESNKTETIKEGLFGKTMSGKTCLRTATQTDGDEILVVAKWYSGFRGCGVSPRFFKDLADFNWHNKQLDEAKRQEKDRPAIDIPCFYVKAHDADKWDNKHGYWIEKSDPKAPGIAIGIPLTSIVTDGKIAEGDAGHAGHTHQYIFTMRPGEIVQIYRDGRTYGEKKGWIYYYSPKGLVGIPCAQFDMWLDAQEKEQI